MIKSNSFMKGSYKKRDLIQRFDSQFMSHYGITKNSRQKASIHAIVWKTPSIFLMEILINFHSTVVCSMFGNVV